jgi:short-subunit dehydrogenase
MGESDAMLDKTFQVNTVAHSYLTREFLPHMVKQNHGHVVTIASMASFAAIANNVAYSCTKASALAFNEGLAQELKHRYNAPKVRTT